MHTPPQTMPTTMGSTLMAMYQLLFDHYGPQHWWPAESPFEVLVGAVLTQNTSWKNVEKAIANLKNQELLSLTRLHELPEDRLALEIRPAGYYNLKARRLKNLLTFLVDQYESSLEALSTGDMRTLREGLLSVKGVGPETADSILLYAGGRPVFVVDAYTYRVLKRHGLAEDPMSYEDLQNLFMDHLPEDPKLYNEFHALLVRVGKRRCVRVPKCAGCPLETWERLEAEA